MSEYESIKQELTEVKSLLKKLLTKEEPKKEWVSGEEACEMLGIKKSTLASYRHNRWIAFRSPRPFQYSVKSIEILLNERTRKVV